MVERFIRWAIGWPEKNNDSDGRENNPKKEVGYRGIIIEGSYHFEQATKAAIDLLSPLSQFQTIVKHLGKIKESDQSGMNVKTKPPRFDVAHPTWSRGSVWYASSIAHDAYHSKLYKDGKEYVGEDAEKACFKFQLEVLYELGATSDLIEYVKKQTGEHGNGKVWW